MNAGKAIKFYGAEWCPDCRKARHLLDRQGCSYEYIDVVKTPGAEEYVTRAGGGKRVIPTIEIDGKVLINPGADELLKELGFAERRREELYDVILIGGGPAGVTGAIYTSRERQKTLLLEKSMIGSQFWATEMIENYPGFPEGISGKELAELFQRQAGTFGAEVLTGKEATDLQIDEGRKIVVAGKEKFFGKTVVIATGTTYKRLNARGEDKLLGRGISYCATCDAPFFKGKDVIVVGGGDTAFQEALFLSGIVKGLHIVQKAPEYTASKILQESLLKRNNVSGQLSSEVIEISGEKRVEEVTLRNIETGEINRRKADGVFIFIGQNPNTGFVRGLIKLDEWGFVKTRPTVFETNVKGVYAAGDVRSGSTKQIASAAGEGVAVSFLVKEAVAEWKPS